MGVLLGGVVGVGRLGYKIPLGLVEGWLIAVICIFWDTLPAELKAVSRYSCEYGGATDVLPASGTVPIPGAIDTNVALTTFQLSVEDPPAIMLLGVATNELIEGNVGVEAGGVDDEDEVFGVADDPGGCTVIWKQPVNPKNSIANVEMSTKASFLFIKYLLAKSLL